MSKELSPEDKLKLFLISNNLPTDYTLNVAKFCPRAMKEYDMDNLVIFAVNMKDDLKKTQKTIKIPPIVYNAAILAGMKKQQGIFDFITETIAKECEDILQDEILNRLKQIERKINS